MLTALDRQIPRTMATQHPDNAYKPKWHHSPLVTTAEEIKESLIIWQQFGCEELNWDWEGKLVEESILERLLIAEFKYFQESPLGHDRFLTFRIPHPGNEKGGRYWRALTNVITSRILAEQAHLSHQPIFELILPMTTCSQDLISVHQDLIELSNFLATRNHTFAVTPDPSSYRLIPLVEEIDCLAKFDQIINEYYLWYLGEFGKQLHTFRPYIARSDPALQSGLLSAVLVSKLAIAKLHAVGQKLNIDMFPMIGVGSLPFRGGLSPLTVDDMLQEYQGVATFTIQSAFRYDYPLPKVIASIHKINSNDFAPPQLLTQPETNALWKMITIGSQYYQQTLPTLVPLITKIAKQVPKRRDRFSSTDSLLAYKRQVGEAQLPRAITFTAALYSLGLPPEFIGMGKALQAINELKNGRELLAKFYPSLRKHLLAAGKYFNPQNLDQLMKKYPELKSYAADVELVQKFLRIKLASHTHHQHQLLTSKILAQLSAQDYDGIGKTIVAAGKIRRSLG